MQQGANIRITPSWSEEVFIVDIQWDTDDLANAAPTGKWWGNIAALLSGIGSNEGEWEWDPVGLTLIMGVISPNPPHFLAWLEGFVLPATSGMQGIGKFSLAIAPTTQPLELSWIVP